MTKRGAFKQLCVLGVFIFVTFPLFAHAETGQKLTFLEKYIVNPLAGLFTPLFTNNSPAPVYNITINKSEVAGTSTPAFEDGGDSPITVQSSGPSKGDILSWINSAISGITPAQNVVNNYVRHGTADGLAKSVGTGSSELQNQINALFNSINTTTLTVGSNASVFSVSSTGTITALPGALNGNVLATSTVGRMALKNLTLPPYRYNSNLSTSTTFSSGTGNFESAVFDGTYMWFGTDTSPGKLVRVNPVDNTSTTYTMNSGENGIYGMATDGTYVYASTYTIPAKILKINPATGERVATFTMDTGEDSILDIAYDGTYIWAVTYTSPLKIIKISPADGTHTTYTMDSGEEYAWTVALDGKYVWVSTDDDSPAAKVIKFNPQDGTHVTQTTTGVNFLEGLAFDGTNMWATALASPAKLVKISSDNTHFTSFTMNSGENSGSALLFDGQNLWVGLNGNNANAVLKVDPKNPYNHTSYSMHASANKISALGYDGVNIWGGTYTNPGSIYRIPNANGNASLTRGEYLDALPSSIRPTLLIQPASTTSWNNSVLTYLGVNATTTSPSNLIDLQIGGTSAFRVNSGGITGIGTTTPYYSLTVASTTGSQIALSAGAGIGQWAFRNAGGNFYLSTTTVAGTATTSTSALTILGSSGNVGIGSTTPQEMLTLGGNFAFTNGAARNLYIATSTSGNGDDLVLRAGAATTDNTSGSLVLSGGAINGSSGSHASRITLQGGSGAGFSGISIIAGSVTAGSNNFNGGNISITAGASGNNMPGGNIILTPGSGQTRGYVGISTSTPWKTLSVNGGVRMPALGNDSTGYYVCLNTTTYALSTSTTACGASSQKYKENISDLNYGLAEVLKLRPVSFDYKDTYLKNARRQVGFIAEEVATVTPEVVAYDDNGEIQGLDYPKFSAIIVKAVQELYRMVRNIEADRIDLKGDFCVDGTCVTKEQFKDMILRSGVGATQTLPQQTSAGQATSTESTATSTATTTPEIDLSADTSTTTASTTPEN